MPETNNLGLPSAKTRPPEQQAQREAILGELRKPVSPEARISAPRTTGSTVSVGCKVPMGLVLRIFEWVDDREPAPGGYKAIKRAQPLEETVTLRGPGNMWRNPTLPGHEMELLQPAGYALTHGISKDFWDKWYEQNESSSLVKNGMVFAGRDESHARDQTKNGRDIFSGLEPLDPLNPSRSIGTVDSRLKIAQLDAPPSGRPSMIAR